MGFLFGKKKTFLVCLQNNNELRSTGGFITKVLQVDVSFLRLKLKFLNVFDDFGSSNVNMPELIGRSLGYKKGMKMQFRDANMLLDDAQNFANMKSIFNDNFDVEVSDIVLVNFSFIENLFGIYGPIKYEGQYWDKSNLFRKMTKISSDIDRHNLEALKSRKDIMKSLLKVLVLSIFLKFYKIFSCLKLIRMSFKNKNIQVLSGEKGGGFRPIYRENNLIGLKNNRYITRKLELMTDINESEIVRTYVFTWFHPGEENWPISGEYNSLFEFEPEKDYEFISGVSVPTRWNEGAKFNVRLKPKESQSIVIKTTKKIDAIPEKYQILYSKQSGVTDSFSETISCPKGYCIDGGVDYVYLYRDYPVSDLEHVIFINKNNYPPRIIQHEIIDKDKIIVRFNEPVYGTEDFEIGVVKKGNDKEFDVEYEWVNGGMGLLVFPSNWKPEEEDFFEVSLQGICNRNGVLMNPKKRIVTVVYRSKYFVS